MSDNVTLDDILMAIQLEWDVYEFMDRFDISFAEVVNRFASRVKPEVDQLAIELGLELEIEEDED